MKFNKKIYDIIVVGAGHAGCEAAIAAANMGCSVLFLTIDMDKVAAMPCSPSIGGMAKGQLVKEIDALGGNMAKICDLSAIQYRTLNTKKGAALHSTRTQNDKIKYQQAMKSLKLLLQQLIWVAVCIFLTTYLYYTFMEGILLELLHLQQRNAWSWYAFKGLLRLCINRV